MPTLHNFTSTRLLNDFVAEEVIVIPIRSSTSYYSRSTSIKNIYSMKLKKDTVLYTSVHWIPVLYNPAIGKSETIIDYINVLLLKGKILYIFPIRIDNIDLSGMLLGPFSQTKVEIPVGHIVTPILRACHIDNKCNISVSARRKVRKKPIMKKNQTKIKSLSGRKGRAPGTKNKLTVAREVVRKLTEDLAKLNAATATTDVLEAKKKDLEKATALVDVFKAASKARSDKRLAKIAPIAANPEVKNVLDVTNNSPTAGSTGSSS